MSPEGRLPDARGPLGLARPPPGMDRPIDARPPGMRTEERPGSSHRPDERPPSAPEGRPHPGLPPRDPERRLSDARPPGAPPSPPPTIDPNIKIKAEVKTEPEYSRDSNSSPQTDYHSSSPTKEDAPRHPKMKVTESKDRRPRFPLGPYAPQYGPYGPYAPPATSQSEPPGFMGIPHRLPPSPLHQFHPSLVQNLNTKPQEPRSPLPRPPHDMQNPMHHPSAYPGGLPPHYMPIGQNPHLRPPIRPHYGMGLPMRHPMPERSSPSQPPMRLPPHYAHPPMPQHPPADLHRLVDKPPPSLPREPVLSPQQSPVSLSKEDTPEEPPKVKVEAPEPTPPASENGAGSRLSPIPMTAEPVASKPAVEEEEKGEDVEKESEKVEPPPPREEGSVFGGLVSYFSSQREDDDIDA